VRKNQDNSAVAVETVAAAQLRIADIVSSEGGLHTVTSLRMQGAPPEMCVEFAGLAGRRHFALTASFEVLRRPQAH
jgi:hypothetical protein